VVQGCQGLVANLNGRVPDEGAVAEAAMAWTAGKSVVLYKSDNRSLMHGADNPLVAGLGQFATLSTIPEVAYAFAQLLRKRAPQPAGGLPASVKSAVEHGRRLSAALAAAKSPAEIVAAVIAATRSTLAKPSRSDVPASVYPRACSCLLRRRDCTRRPTPERKASASTLTGP